MHLPAVHFLSLKMEPDLLELLLDRELQRQKEVPYFYGELEALKSRAATSKLLELLAFNLWNLLRPSKARLQPLESIEPTQRYAYLGCYWCKRELSFVSDLL